MAINSTVDVDLAHLLPLFDVGQSAEYQYWKSDGGASWQLRCIGGPGSGKTTLSCLIIEDLRSSFKGPKTAIISVFLQRLSAHAVNGNSLLLSTQLLLELQHQLKSNTPPSDLDRERNEEEPDKSQKRHENEDEALFEWIRDQVKPLDRAFLVIDDLDLAFHDITQYRELESQLSQLQGLGFKLLTTSRVPYLTGELRGCDVETHTGPAQLRFWWHCETCGSGAYDICQECKNAGNGCNIATDTSLFLMGSDHAGLSLVHEPSKVQFYISHFFLPEGLSVLVRDAIQREHGDLGLDSPAQTSPGSPPCLPPLSHLGQELATPANKTAGVAEQLVEETASRSDDVVAVALLRLNHLWKAKTLKEARAVPDRLPRELLNVFDAGIAYVAAQTCDTQRFLGLQSIRIVGKFVEQIETPYEELKAGLREMWQGDESKLSDVLDSEDGLEQVLFAARGFLTSRKIWGGIWVKCYQVDFHLYVAENYSEVLSQL
ncbi:tol protein [Apiospora marii]|uniref:tol protein n=1 Tax=Apiospora marii TaxID=335849 RepID=UPI003131F253